MSESFLIVSTSQAENYMRELARDYRIRRTYPMEPLRRDKRGMRGDTFEPDTRAKGGYHGQVSAFFSVSFSFSSSIIPFFFSALRKSKADSLTTIG